MFFNIYNNLIICTKIKCFLVSTYIVSCHLQSTESLIIGDLKTYLFIVGTKY